MSWRSTRVSPLATHHVLSGAPLYAERFDEVLSFHEPGLAAVRRSGEAWHVRLDGSPAYGRRFLRTFGLYEGLAAVVSPEGWHHVRADGTDLYPERYAWAGNFQGGRCAVRERSGSYLHLTSAGAPAYRARWRYAGDLRGGIGVVQGDDGRSSHVDEDGRSLHGVWFLDLDVFHKGLARARDELGWTHVDRRGAPAYERRFAAVEPFYNGQARVERFDGGLEVIDQRGVTQVELRPPPHAPPLEGRVLARTPWGRVHLVEREGEAPFVSKWTRANNDREVEVLLALRGHPGVPTLLGRERGDMSDQLRLRYCAGEPVGQPRRLRAYPEREALRITREVLSVCAALHEAGWIHTDVHPGNVLAGEPATLLDYACAVRAAYGRPWRGEINWGVWEYVPPEQLADYGQLDPATDVYSAAALCVAMLRGAPPIRIEVERHLRAGGWPAVRAAFLAARHVEGLDDLRAPLARALAPALSLDPARRPTARRLTEDLAHV
ncbi:MAG: hypothetical protein IT376_15975 [Polyangiaceae bacterium]|nr:hypothetical protein [Polyangiaceae bacterium]